MMRQNEYLLCKGLMDFLDPYLQDDLLGILHHGDALTLYQTTFVLDWTKFKAFADDNAIKMKISLFDGGKKTWEKEKMLVISILVRLKVGIER